MILPRLRKLSNKIRQIPVRVSLKDLDTWNPLKIDAWGVGNIHREDVLQSIQEDLLIAPGVRYIGRMYDYHVRRIAWLVKNGWDEPIQVNLSKRFAILDGSHRLAAALAFIRGDTYINVLFE